MSLLKNTIKRETVKDNDNQKNSSENNSNNENIKAGTGTFTGFVLLDEVKWDRGQLIHDFKNDWDIDIPSELETEENYQDIICAEIGNMLLVVSFLDVPVPNGEAEYYAEVNYMWKEAVEVTKTHKAQLIVAILGTETDVYKRATLFVSAVASCLKQKHAIAVYADGAVYEREYYREASGMIRESELPIFNLIWFGLYRDEKQAGIYTYGMKKFGKEELEVYVPVEKADLAELHDFTSDIVLYILENDVILNDGETIGFSENQRLPITYSDGIALEGKTLKIQYM